jgi:hypothetical protein
MKMNNTKKGSLSLQNLIIIVITLLGIFFFTLAVIKVLEILK